MCEHRLVAFIYKVLDFFSGIEFPDTERVAYRKFHQDMVAFPWHEPSVTKDVGPSFLNDAVFHRREDLKGDILPCQSVFEDPVLPHDVIRGVVETVVAVGSAYGSLVPERHQMSSQ